MAWWEWNATGNPQHPHVVVCAHGLSRQGRDFDTLARALCHRVRVVCPDVVGRGHSDWLADPIGYHVGQYAADMLALLQHLHQQSPLDTLDWVGTSMGGLIGMALCGQPGLPLPAPVRALNSAIMASQAGTSACRLSQNDCLERAVNSSSETPCCSTQVK